MTATDATSSDPATAILSGAPSPFLPRGRTVQVGTAVITAATLMFFGGLFAIYVGSRNSHLAVNRAIEEAGGKAVPWIPSGAKVELTAPTIMTWTLLMSIVTMAWVVYAFKRGDRRHGLLAIATNMVFGAAVINQVAFQWKQLGLVIDDVTGSSAATLIYVITAAHMAMIIVALLWLGLLALRLAAADRPSTYLDHAASVATYWYAMVALYLIIWILIFITK